MWYICASLCVVCGYVCVLCAHVCVVCGAECPIRGLAHVDKWSASELHPESLIFIHEKPITERIENSKWRFHCFPFCGGRGNTT